MTRNTSTELLVTDSTGKIEIADSQEEFWIANALHHANARFLYQVDQRGGRRFPGGFVFDFIVLSGLETVIDYLGEPFHRDDEGIKWSWARLNFDRVFLPDSGDIYDQASAIQYINSNL